MKLIKPEKMKKDILRAIQKHIRNNLKGTVRLMQSRVQNTIMDAVLSSPTTKALESGDLRGELGVEKANTAGIALAVSQIVKVKVDGPKMTGDKILLKVRIEGGQTDLNTIKGAVDGIQETEKGQKLRWLEWLLTLGDAVIVKEFEVKAGFADRSRTGDKIMVRGKGWRVPPQHAGNEDNNFLTKAIDSVLPKIEKDLMDLFSNGLRG
tara:strand:- start:615 stop:1238 length:624 start_codon:yes stop_codon:yes gene_type:complete